MKINHSKVISLKKCKTTIELILAARAIITCHLLVKIYCFIADSIARALLLLLLGTYFERRTQGF